jgi:L-2-hydroxycarboxylate dehydrogenase (NAD+)
MRTQNDHNPNDRHDSEQEATMTAQTNTHDPYAWTDEPRFPYEQLHDFSTRMFESAGLTNRNARTAATNMLIADMRGVETHGVQRLSFYLRGFATGAIDPNGLMSVVRELPSTIALDGGRGLGLVMAQEAMERCIAKAEETGICLATVRNSSHFGIAGRYALMAAERGLCGMAMTNTSPLVVPTFARDKALGTNPIAFAAPTSRTPFCLDMSTATVAVGKIEVAKRLGIPIPEGWAMDADGELTTDPFQASGLTPLGGSRMTSGHKGYGLGLMVEIFCGQLAGNPWSMEIPRTHEGGDSGDTGHMFMAWRVDAFREQDAFIEEMDRMVDLLHGMEVAEVHRGQQVLVPGEPEAEAEERNRQLGVPVRRRVLEELDEEAAKLGVEPLVRSVG